MRLSNRKSTHWPFIVPASAVVVAICLLAIAAPLAQAAEEETHLFNAAHSLTGGCGSSGLDPVPDPGCPGGAHPSEPFNAPKGLASDPYGDLYVVSTYFQAGSEKARVDVFDPEGSYLTSVAAPAASTIAVDASGHLYVYVIPPGTVEPEPKILRFDPTVYEPEAGKIEYGSPPVTVLNVNRGDTLGLAVNPANQHLYAAEFGHVTEFGSAEEAIAAEEASEPYPVITEEIGKGALHGTKWVAVDAAHGRLYVSNQPQIGWESEIKVFETNPPYALLQTVEGPGLEEKFVASEARTAVAAEEASGHFFVADIRQLHKVYEFDADGNLVWTYKHGFEGQNSGIHLDNGAESPNRGYLYVTSGDATPSHVYAFELKPEVLLPPAIESSAVTGVTESEAVLHAKINPGGLATHYAIEYVTEQAYEETGFAGATLAGEGEIGASSEGVAVSAPAHGLTAGTAYRFRVLASNECEPGGCSDEAERRFATFADTPPVSSCPNEALRTGASAALPDCRAYELVTPVNTNGRQPSPTAGLFGSATASPQGEELLFMIHGGPIPGTEGSGNVYGDAYLASRGAQGWQTQSATVSAKEAGQAKPFSVSSDQGYMVWEVPGFSPIAIEGKNTLYLRHPDGSLHPVGQGSLGVDPEPFVRYVSPGASHVIFNTEETNGHQLEPNAPPGGTRAIYDRTSDGVTHVVSLLPEEVTPAVGEDALYKGSSDDGGTVAFRLGGGTAPSSPLYLRLGNTQTLVAAPVGATFAGLAAEGRYLFYLLGGNLFRFDAQEGETIQITAGGDARPVLVPAQGTGAYFVSHGPLGEGANPNGDEPQEGKENLYYWDGTAVRFVGTLTERDVVGQLVGSEFRYGLREWMDGVASKSVGSNPARATPTGEILLFESRADLTEFDSGGKAQVYRYDAGQGTLDCLSCPQSGEALGGEAALLTFGDQEGPGGDDSLVPNISPDGRRAFFESAERLVLADNDNVTDVYEWEAQGKGSCTEPGGCLFLISSGQSAKPNYLYGVSESGDDVFIETADLLTAADSDEALSVYDVRVGGGFPPPPTVAGECLGEACQPAAVAPNDPTPASSSFQGQGNVVPAGRPRCPKGKRPVRRGGKRRCLPARRGHHKRKQAKAKGRVGR
jgi:hypothetical protein